MNTKVHLWYLFEFFLEWEMFQKKNFGENKKTSFSMIIFKFSAIYETLKKIKNILGHKWPYGTCVRPSGYLSLETLIQNIKMFSFPL